MAFPRGAPSEEQRARIGRKPSRRVLEQLARNGADPSRCAICREGPAEGKRLDVDHDHVTNRARDYLCRRHNLMIGWANDDPEILRAAISYLEKHGATA